ncbi:MAG: response regulator transcription factor [Pseudomonadota bacterium]
MSQSSLPEGFASPPPGRASTQQPQPLADDAPHILIVDDDERIRDLLSRFLQSSGFRVTPKPDAASARAALKGMAFDLILLDVMMPGESGLSLAASLRETNQVPICMLTANSEPRERIEGLETGVDDYVSKPFEPRELLLRIQNILKRGVAPAVRDVVTMGDLTFSITRGELKRGSAPVKLTERERDLLRQFAQRPGASIARHELAPDDTTGSERAIDVQINRLRRKIETDPSNPIHLQTVRGKGYVLYTD